MCIKIFLADDHLIVREGIKQLLELDKNLKVIGEASNGEATIEKILEQNADILLLDINMPNINGIDVVKYLRKKKVDIKIIMLTIHDEVEYLMKALEVGCDGYVLKDSDSNTLKGAIYDVYNNEKFIQPSMVPLLNKGLALKETNFDKIDGLTKREIEVLKLIAEGLFNKEIASKLAISERTVKNHISNIFKKIDVSDRTQAAVFAIKNNLVELL